MGYILCVANQGMVRMERLMELARANGLTECIESMERLEAEGIAYSHQDFDILAWTAAELRKLGVEVR